jgi:hypothetical protein
MLGEGGPMPATIKNYSIPKRLYRYRSLLGKDGSDVLDREMRAIEERFIWTAGRDSMNDPREGFYQATSRARANDDFEALRERIYDRKQAIGLASFSETNKNDLMWAHYAGQFTGICIAYRFARLRRGMADGNDFVRMNYSDTLPKIRATADQPQERDLQAAKEILSFKNHLWIYEREWRLMSPQLGRVRYEERSSVPTVYLGARIDPDHEREIRGRMSAIGVEVGRMEIKDLSMRFLIKRKRAQAS